MLNQRGGGELAALRLVLSVGGVLRGLDPRRLLVQQVAQTLTEFVKRCALAGKQKQPEPFCFLRLLYKQLACVRRGHGHLPFRGRLAAVRWR